MHVWIIGAGGLFGSSLVEVGNALGHQIVTSTNVEWNNHSHALAHLNNDAERFLSSSRKTPSKWAIVWAAGSVTTAASERDAQEELELYRKFVENLRGVMSRYSSEELSVNSGVFCLISSAGAMYAGSEHPPFSSASTPAPLGTYGYLKKEQERITTETLSEECGVLLARVANLYGPGQNLEKLQGLISRLALAAITREPISMFVPLDTLRDFIYVDDAAGALFYWLARSEGQTTIRVIASGNPVSLGYLINVMQVIAHTRIPVAYGMHPSAHAQGRDIRLSPDWDRDLDVMTRTQLPAGMKDVYLDIFERHQMHAHVSN